MVLIYNIKNKNICEKKAVNILKDNERIDDLQINNLKIIQNKNGFCFGIDSVLIANFANDIKEQSNVIDLGTGTGIISFLLLAKNNLKHVTGIEVQKDVADMAKRSIELNCLENKFNIINCNIKDILKNVEKEKFDVAIMNPPYKKNNTGGKNIDEKKLISRHEVLANIFDFINAAKNVLKDKGIVYIVHRPERLADLMYALRLNKIEPKKLQFVYSKRNSNEAKLVLIKAVKNGGEFLKIEKPIFIYEDDGSYTDDIMKIYNNKK